MYIYIYIYYVLICTNDYVTYQGFTCKTDCSGILYMFHACKFVCKVRTLVYMHNINNDIRIKSTQCIMHRE